MEPETAAAAAPRVAFAAAAAAAAEGSTKAEGGGGGGGNLPVYPARGCSVNAANTGLWSLQKQFGADPYASSVRSATLLCALCHSTLSVQLGS